MKSVRVWDIPIRLFHWILVALLIISFYTGLTGGFEIMDYHMLSGYCVLTLVIFRIVWGLIGSYHARFINFVKGPVSVFSHLLQLKDKSSPSQGHNPLGALSILAMLLVLLIQASTGLFANDDIMLEGPLAYLVSYDMSRTLTAIHKSNIWVIGGLVSLHIVAIACYQFIRGEPLLKAMITGNKSLPDQISSTPAPNLTREIVLGAVTLTISAAFVYAVITFA